MATKGTKSQKKSIPSLKGKKHSLLKTRQSSNKNLQKDRKKNVFETGKEKKPDLEEVAETEA